MHQRREWEEEFPGGCYVVLMDDLDDNRLFQLASHSGDGPELRCCEDTRRTVYPDYEDIRLATKEEREARKRFNVT